MISVSSFKELKDLYNIKVLNDHIKTDFDPWVGRTFEYENYLFLKYNPKTREKPLKKIIAIDVDGVLNASYSPPFILRLVEKLERKYPKIERRHSDLMIYLKKAEEDNFMIGVRGVADIFYEAGVRKDIFYEYCIEVALETPLVYNANEFIAGMYLMDYVPFLASGSPFPLVMPLGKRLNIPESQILATEFHFDEDGKFNGKIDPMLGPLKSEGIDKKILEEKILSQFGLKIIVSDNPVADGPIVKSGINLNPAFWLTKTHELVGNVALRFPEARENMGLLPKKVKQFEKGYITTLLKDPKVQNKIIWIADKIKKEKEKCLRSNGKIFFKHRGTLIDCSEVVLDLIRPLFPTESTEIKLNLERLKREKDVEVCKELVTAVVDTFKNRSWEFNASEDVKAFITEVEDVWNSKFPGHNWWEV